MKASGVLPLALMTLAACTSSPGTAAATPVETNRMAPTPTPGAFWDLLPLDSQPVGGWRVYRNDELNFAFQYPSVYDEVDCGKIFVAEKEGYTLVGFEDGSPSSQG